MSLETWKLFFEIGGVLLLFLTFVFGAGALFTSTQINERQAQQLRTFEKELTDAKTELKRQEVRAAVAEKETAELQAEVAGRHLSQKQLVEISTSLKRFVGREVFISSYSGDSEAARLGLQINAALERAGVHVSDQLGRTIASGGGVSFGVNVTGPAGDRDLVNAISEALKKAHIEGTADVKDSAGIRFGNALTGIMVALRPLAENK